MSKEIELPKSTGKGRPLNSNCNCAIFGTKGSWKTSTTEERFIRNKRRLLVLDILGEYGKAEFCAATGIQYDAVVDDEAEFRSVLARCVGKSGTGPFRIVVRGTKEQLLNDMRLIEYDWRRKSALLTDTTIVIEEISFYMSGSYIEEPIANHLQYGRHSRNNLIGIARVPRKETNPLFRSQMDMIISFRQTEQSAIDWFNDYDPEKAAKLRSLNPGEYELFQGESKELMDFIEQP